MFEAVCGVKERFADVLFNPCPFILSVLEPDDSTREVGEIFVGRVDEESDMVVRPVVNADDIINELGWEGDVEDDGSKERGKAIPGGVVDSPRFARDAVVPGDAFHCTREVAKGLRPELCGARAPDVGEQDRVHFLFVRFDLARVDAV